MDEDLRRRMRRCHYSKGLESTDADGMRASGTNKNGVAVYVCASCDCPMTLVRKKT